MYPVENLHLTQNFYTTSDCDGCDKYEVCFQGWAKMMGWLQPDSIPHRLSTQIHTKTSQSSPHIPKYHLDTPRRLSRHQKTTPYTTDTNRQQQTYSKTQRRLSDTPQTILRHPSKTPKHSLVPQSSWECWGDI